MIAGGAQAKDTHVVAMVVPGKQFPLIADIEKVVYGAGKGNMQNPARVGTIYYNRGVIAAVNMSRRCERAEDTQQGRQAGHRRRIPRRLRSARFHRGEAQGDRHCRHVRRSRCPARIMRAPALQDDAMGRQKFQIVTDWVEAKDPTLFAS